MNKYIINKEQVKLGGGLNCSLGGSIPEFSGPQQKREEGLGTGDEWPPK